MSSIDKKIIIAKHCGWTDCCHIRGDCKGIPPEGYKGDRISLSQEAWIPNYLSDLNAIHKVEETLSVQQCYFYNQELLNSLGPWMPSDGPKTWMFHASAEQRVHAFLRVLGYED